MTKKQVSTLKDVLLQDKKNKVIQTAQEDRSDLIQFNFLLDICHGNIQSLKSSSIIQLMTLSFRKK